ncbi:hypothetical protein YC2023_106563 [Brassica napus]
MTISIQTLKPDVVQASRMVSGQDFIQDYNFFSSQFLSTRQSHEHTMDRSVHLQLRDHIIAVRSRGNKQTLLKGMMSVQSLSSSSRETAVFLKLKFSP